MSEWERFLRQAIALMRENVRKGGRPFGAVVMNDGAVAAAIGRTAGHSLSRTWISKSDWTKCDPDVGAAIATDFRASDEPLP
jgi:hypothetical protein